MSVISAWFREHARRAPSLAQNPGNATAMYTKRFHIDLHLCCHLANNNANYDKAAITHVYYLDV